MVGAYLQAFIRRYAGQAWAAISPGVDSDVVKYVFTHDPEQHDFKANDLPALYLFRTGSAKDPENTTEDWRVTADTVKVFWVLPPTADLKQGARSRAIGQVAKIIDYALRKGRDPSYVVEGDVDPQATLEGSVVIRHAGLMKLEATRWTSGRVAIARLPRQEQTTHNLYDALLGQLVITERVIELPGEAVPAEVGPTLQNTFPAGVSATVTVNGVTSGEYREPEDLLDP